MPLPNDKPCTRCGYVLHKGPLDNMCTRTMDCFRFPVNQFKTGTPYTDDNVLRGSENGYIFLKNPKAIKRGFRAAYYEHIKAAPAWKTLTKKERSALRYVPWIYAFRRKYPVTVSVHHVISILEVHFTELSISPLLHLPSTDRAAFKGSQ